jgi:hypothetical protein
VIGYYITLDTRESISHAGEFPIAKFSDWPYQRQGDFLPSLLNRHHGAHLLHTSLFL